MDADPATRRPDLRTRVEEAAEAALESKRCVEPIDVLLDLQWLAPPHVDQWKKGYVATLDAMIRVRPEKLRTAFETLASWARLRGLRETDSERMGVHGPLQFTRAGEGEEELRFRRLYLDPTAPPQVQERARTKAAKPPDIVVFEALGDWTCSVCGDDSRRFLRKEGENALCLPCADLGGLEYLPAGDAALTRRSKAASRRWAVVVRFSRSRGHYERQGLLVEPAALARAEEECFSDADVRERRREREALHRVDEDEDLVARMGEAIRRLFPGCPPAVATVVARHTGRRGSGRVGRSAAGRALDERALELALAAHVRHERTVYDDLLMAGNDRATAREQVRDEVARSRAEWRRPAGAG